MKKSLLGYVHHTVSLLILATLSDPGRSPGGVGVGLWANAASSLIESVTAPSSNKLKRSLLMLLSRHKRKCLVEAC